MIAVQKLIIVGAGAFGREMVAWAEAAKPPVVGKWLMVNGRFSGRIPVEDFKSR